MDKYIITYNNKELMDREDYEKLIITFNSFLSKEEDNLLLINKEIFDGIEIYKVDLVDNNIERMEIKGK